MNELVEEDKERVFKTMEEIRKTLRYLTKFVEQGDLFGTCVGCGVLQSLTSSLHEFVSSKWTQINKEVIG